MTIIAVLAIAAMWLLTVTGPDASVGGPIGMMMICLVAAVAVAVQVAMAHRRGPPGVIGYIIMSVIGGFVAVTIFNLGVMETLLADLALEGSLAASPGPMKYLVLAVMALVTVLGSWAPLQLFRRRPPASMPA